MIDNNLNTLNLMVMNSKSATKNNENDKSGIGLVNVERRLELLYPQSHNIIIEEKDDLYTVNLEINL